MANEDGCSGDTSYGQIISHLKAGQSQELPVVNRSGQPIGALVPITPVMANDISLLEDLCRWRAANMLNFFTVFEPSVAKTRDYLERFSLPDPARILFLIKDGDGRRVGNIGLCNITAASAEVDNVIRGESVELRDFMRFVQWSLAHWAFSELGLDRLFLEVLADNRRAIASYERAGFGAVGRHALTKKPIPGGYQLIPAIGGMPEDSALLRMELDRASLRQARSAAS